MLLDPRYAEGAPHQHLRGCARRRANAGVCFNQGRHLDGALPVEPEEGKKVKRNAARYTLVDGVLFRHGFTHPILTCVSGDECTRIMAELHEGICGSHVGGRSLASKVIRAGFFWPTVKEDCARHAQRCRQCQKHADWHKAPTPRHDPSLGSYLSQGRLRGGRGTSRVRLLCTGTISMAFKPPFSMAFKPPFSMGFKPPFSMGFKPPFSFLYHCPLVIRV